VAKANAAPPTEPRGGRLSRGAKIALAVGVVVLVAAVVSIIVVLGYRSSRTRPVSYSSQVVLPFPGIAYSGVAVDTGGNLYVTDFNNNRVLKLAAGASVPTPLPFADLDDPRGVAVDTRGNLYVIESGRNPVLKLAAGASAPTVLPFTGLNHPTGVAVDTGGGNLYVTDYLNNRALKLAAGASAPTVLPFTGLFEPAGVAVDTVGNVYVIDYNNFPPRVLKLPVQ
jgi:serine/threonine protein kinase, bacterial